MGAAVGAVAGSVAGAAASHQGTGSSCVAYFEHEPQDGSKQHKGWLLLRPLPEMISQIDNYCRPSCCGLTLQPSHSAPGCRLRTLPF